MEGLNWLISPKGRGPVVVCLHGFLGGPDDWSEFAVALAARRPGIGVAAPALPMLWAGGIVPPARLAGDLEQALMHEGVSSAILAGYSMGGRAGLEITLRKPERFPEFVGISTTGGLETFGERQERRATDSRLAARMRSGNWREFLDYWWRQPVFCSPKRDLDPPSDYLTTRLRLNPSLMADWLEAWSPGRLESQWENLARYRGRTLWIAGSEDSKYVRESRRLNQTCIDSRSVVIAGCGHQLLREAPKELAFAVESFISERIFHQGSS